MQAALFTSHPYGKPIIGWKHEIETLDRARRPHLLPALLHARERHPDRRRRRRPSTRSMRLAQDSYGKIPARGEAPAAPAPAGAAAARPPARHAGGPEGRAAQRAARLSRALLPHRRAGTRWRWKCWRTILGGGQTSLLYRGLVLEQRIAVAAGAYYMGTSLDDTRFYIWAMPAEA